MTFAVTTAEAQSNHWRFAGVSPGLVIEGDLEGAGYAFVGMEGTFWHGLGYSADGGYAAYWRNPKSGVGVISVGGLVFPGSVAGNRPFVSIGYSLGFRSQSLNLLHVGLGVTRLIEGRVGARFEVRDYIFSDGKDPDTHIVAFRFAVVF